MGIWAVGAAGTDSKQEPPHTHTQAARSEQIGVAVKRQRCCRGTRNWSKVTLRSKIFCTGTLSRPGAVASPSVPMSRWGPVCPSLLPRWISLTATSQPYFLTVPAGWLRESRGRSGSTVGDAQATFLSMVNGGEADRLEGKCE